MIERADYIEKLIPFTDKPIIKVITGIRRSGKSTILKILQNHFLKKGIDNKQLLYINLESFEYSTLNTAPSLYNFVKSKIDKKKKTYIFLDEIQEVKNWEKAINSFIVDFDVDIYITGSNSHILSSELSTFIAGRFVEIPIFTLSFSEYLNFKATENNSSFTLKQSFEDYLKFGGFPVIHINNYEFETAYKIVYDIYTSVVLRDTIQRHKIRDIELLERVIKYTFENIGNTFSGKNVADYFKSQNRKVDINTIYNYLYALEGSFVLHKVSRFDLKGKEILKTQEKYYLGDISLLYATFGFKSGKISGILENIVYLELKKRGYKIYIGKEYDKEIDFVAKKKEEIIYIQVCYKLESKETIEREFSILSSLKDQYPKYVVTMDDFWNENINGIQHIHIADFLLKEDF